MTGEGGWRNFYGRRRGKALRPAQRQNLEDVLPRVRVPGFAPGGQAPDTDGRCAGTRGSRVEGPGQRVEASGQRAKVGEQDFDPTKQRVKEDGQSGGVGGQAGGAGGQAGGAVIDPAALFPAVRDVWLEIGFGGGEHLYWLARTRPDIGFIGCEPFVNGVAMLLGKLAEDDPGNIRVHPGDARDLVDRLPHGVLGRVYLLYPDPWPKARHRKRRFVTAESLSPLALRMASGAELRLATDIPDYAEHAVAGVAETGLLAPVVAGEPDWARPWPGWEGTRYETKALREGRKPYYLVWRRR